MFLLAISLLAQSSAPTSEAEKWVGPILASTASCFATLFAYLGARDKLRYDATMQIQGNAIAQLQRESAECGKDRTALRRQVRRLCLNMQAMIQDKPPPFPNEVGFPDDGDQEKEVG